LRNLIIEQAIKCSGIAGSNTKGIPLFNRFAAIDMKVLVVDDAPYLIKALRDVLEAYSHDVFEAFNGEDALARYAEVRPDVVLMDILMPTLDGVSAMKRIMEQDHKANIIVITAVGKSGLEKECLAAGAKKFVVKPFKIKELLNSIESLART
jgi:two-component system chemotaxis response regulator CheY